MWFLGLGSVLSFNVLDSFHPLAFIPGFEERTIYDSFDYIMANVLLPLGALMTSVFIGWFATRESIRDQMGLGESAGYKIWFVLIRYVVPVAVAIIFVGGLVG